MTNEWSCLQITALSSDEEYGEFQSRIAANPDLGALIKGGGGIRKIRVAVGSRGKSGGARVIYTIGRCGRRDPAALRVCEERSGEPDSETTLATRQTSQRGVRIVKRQMFEELLGSIREAGAILRGRQKPSRRIVIRSSAVRVIRERTSLSQSEFAQLIGVSVKTLQNWEQDRRRPTGPAAALLSIIEHDPALAVKAIHRL